MKKILNVIFALCFLFIGWKVISLNKELNTVQASYNNLQERYYSLCSGIGDYYNQATPLSVDEVKILQHNIDVLNEFYPIANDCAIAIASKCHELKRRGQMESSWIVSVTRHTTPVKYIEIITDDGEHYWFDFGSSLELGSSISFSKIYKGANREIPIAESEIPIGERGYDYVITP